MLIADANTGWRVDDAIRVVNAVRDRDVYIEQPCRTYEHCLTVRRHTTLPFILDENITGIDALLLAHQALEDCVNTRLQNQFRHQVAQRWAELVYTGFFDEPHKYDLEAYLESSQQFVTGEVTLRTSGGTLAAVAVDSPYRVSNPDAVYAQSASWTPEEAEGFIKLIGQSSTTAAKVRGQS